MFRVWYAPHVSNCCVAGVSLAADGCQCPCDTLMILQSVVDIYHGDYNQPAASGM